MTTWAFSNFPVPTLARLPKIETCLAIIEAHLQGTEKDLVPLADASPCTMNPMHYELCSSSSVSRWMCPITTRCANRSLT